MLGDFDNGVQNDEEGHENYILAMILVMKIKKTVEVVTLTIVLRRRIRHV